MHLELGTPQQLGVTRGRGTPGVPGPSLARGSPGVHLLTSVMGVVKPVLPASRVLAGVGTLVSTKHI